MTRDRLLGVATAWAMIGGAVAAVGCDGTGAAPEALTCPQIVDALRARIAIDGRACVTVGDCDLVGNGVDRTGFPSCNETISFAGLCHGDGVNQAAWGGDATAAALEREWYDRCVPQGTASGVTGYYDCAPGTLSCEGGQCVARPQSCFAGPDAGVR